MRTPKPKKEAYTLTVKPTKANRTMKLYGKQNYPKLKLLSK
jgi:hypothetical protein